MRNPHYLAALLCFALASCATTKSAHEAPWPWNHAKSPICTDKNTCNSSDARTALAQASLYCRQVMDRRDTTDFVFGGTKLGVGTLGAIAGGVIAQFAQGTASQAWAGVSGVANGIQSQMDTFFSHAVDLKRRQNIAKAALSGAVRVRDADTPEDKVERSMEMALACSMNAATADAAVLDLLDTNSEKSEHAAVSESLSANELTLVVPYTTADSVSEIEEKARDRATKACKFHNRTLDAKNAKTLHTCLDDRCKVTSVYTCKDQV